MPLLMRMAAARRLGATRSIAATSTTTRDVNSQYRPAAKAAATTTATTTTAARPSSGPAWGLLADLHLDQPQSDTTRMADLEKTVAWAIDAFRKHGVTKLFLLGDILNTREMVSIPALSKAVEMLRTLSNAFETYVIPGNHDMHLRNSRRVTSLDFLDLQDQIRFLREPALRAIDNTHVIFLPYHEDGEAASAALAQYARDIRNADDRPVVMTHLSIDGAVPRRGTVYGGGVPPAAFAPFAHTFSGHFHIHQSIPPRPPPAQDALIVPASQGGITYVGSPLQFHFGDVDDTRRGGLVYWPQAHTFMHLANPHAERFVRLPASTVRAFLKPNGKAGKSASTPSLAGKQVWLEGHTATEYSQLRSQLFAAGALSVRRSTVTAAEATSSASATKNVAAEDSAKTGDASAVTGDGVPADAVLAARESFSVVDALPAYLASLKTLTASEQEALQRLALQLYGDAMRETASKLATAALPEEAGEAPQPQPASTSETSDGIAHASASTSAASSSSESSITPSSPVAEVIISNNNNDNDNTPTTPTPPSPSTLTTTTTTSSRTRPTAARRTLFKGEISRLTIQNFLSVKGCMVVPISEMKDGVWFVRGVNGSGKSVLLEAISWCLFDTFIRSSMRAEYAVNEDAGKDCRVRIDFANGWSVERTRKSKRKTLGVRVFHNGKYMENLDKGAVQQTQRLLEELIGADFNIFTRMALISSDSFQLLFSSKTNEVRLVLEDLMGLSECDMVLEQANSSLRALSTSVELNRQQLKNASSSVDSLTSKVKTLKEQQMSVSEQCQEITKQLRSIAPDGDSTPESQKTQLANLQQIVDNNQARIQLVEKALQLRELTAEAERAVQPTSELDRFVLRIKTRLKRVFPWLPFTLPDVEKEKRALAAKRNLDLEDLERAASSCNDEYASLGRERTDVMNRMTALMRTMQETQQLKTKGATLSERLVNVTEQLSSLTALLARNKRLAAAAENKTAELEVQKTQLEILSKIFGRREWTTGASKQQHLPLRDAALTPVTEEFNKLVSQNLAQLGDSGLLELQLANEALFDGNLTLNRNFSKLSSGQRRRVGLAVSFALWEMAWRYSAHQLDYLILDETFDNLDKTGLEAAERLMQSVSKIVRKIFVVSHLPNFGSSGMSIAVQNKSGTMMFDNDGKVQHLIRMLPAEPVDSPAAAND
eukprot:m.205358 g.205358  ORF g.205358 m.205358 type:complete len:1174 (-) comp17758_c0_seq2:1679-5200(-)